MSETVHAIAGARYDTSDKTTVMIWRAAFMA
jgi:hypothetical protein